MRTPMKIERSALVAVALLLAGGRAAAADEPSEAADASEPFKNRLAMKVAAGGAYRRLFDVPIYGGDFALALGVDMGHLAMYGTLDVLLGSTRYGLATTSTAIGYSIELREDQVGLGVELRSSFFHVQRASGAGSLDSVGLGLAPFLTWDFAAWDRHALYLSAKVTVDDLGGEQNSLVWGPTLSVGLRL